jgi:glycerol-3-phosphate acyltransferase PlsY
MLPIIGILGGEILILGAATTLFVSLGSIAGVVGTYVILVPMTIVNGFPIEYLIYSLGGTGMIIYTHRGNIKRLLSGRERKLGEKAEKSTPPPETGKGT